MARRRPVARRVTAREPRRLPMNAAVTRSPAMLGRRVWPLKSGARARPRSTTAVWTFPARRPPIAPMERCARLHLCSFQRGPPPPLRQRSERAARTPLAVRTSSAKTARKVGARCCWSARPNKEKWDSAPFAAFTRGRATRLACAAERRRKAWAETITRAQRWLIDQGESDARRPLPGLHARDTSVVLREPLDLPLLDAYGGCRSWVEPEL